PNGVGMVLIAALEKNHWSFAKLRASDDRPLATQAVRQIVPIVSQKAGISPSRISNTLIKAATTPTGIEALTLLLPRIMPFDIEAYLRIHFTKVGDQTRFFMKSFIHDGEVRGLPTGALRDL